MSCSVQLLMRFLRLFSSSQSHMRQRAVSRNETYFHLLEEARLTGDLVAIAAAETKWSEMKYAGQRIIDDIVRLHETYQAEGLYHRTKDLVIHDIVVQIYRPNVPCVWRILCGWFNEVNYLSFRGQLNLFVGAARENTTWMMSTTNNATALGDGHGHLRVC
jgi:hypothetical protein